MGIKLVCFGFRMSFIALCVIVMLHSLISGHILQRWLCCSIVCVDRCLLRTRNFNIQLAFIFVFLFSYSSFFLFPSLSLCAMCATIPDDLGYLDEIRLKDKFDFTRASVKLRKISVECHQNHLACDFHQFRHKRVNHNQSNHQQISQTIAPFRSLAKNHQLSSTQKRSNQIHRKICKRRKSCQLINHLTVISMWRALFCCDIWFIDLMTFNRNSNHFCAIIFYIWDLC